MPRKLYTVEVLDSDAGCAIVVGRDGTGYAVVRYSRDACETVEQIERDAALEQDRWPASASRVGYAALVGGLRRLRRYAVPVDSPLHVATIERWESIHGGPIPLAQYRRDHNGG